MPEAGSRLVRHISRAFAQDPEFAANLLAGMQTLARSIESVAQLVLDAIGPAAEATARALDQVKNGAPVRGYEDFFIARGHSGLDARLRARYVVYFGKKVHGERRLARQVSSAVWAIAGLRAPTSLTVSRRAQVLAELVARGGEALLARSCSDAGLPLGWTAISELLRAASARDVEACSRLVDICQTIRPHLVDPRGRKQSLPSVCHEVLLHSCRSAYTYSSDENDVVDAVTRATRVAFRDRGARVRSDPAHRRRDVRVACSGNDQAPGRARHLEHSRAAALDRCAPGA